MFSELRGHPKSRGHDTRSCAGVDSVGSFPVCHQLSFSGVFVSYVRPPQDKVPRTKVYRPHFSVVSCGHNLFDGGLRQRGKIPSFVNEVQLFKHCLRIGGLVEQMCRPPTKFLYFDWYWCSIFASNKISIYKSSPQGLVRYQRSFNTKYHSKFKR
jgi:hypothetical protein